MSVFYKISIDRVNDNYISGWCFHRIYPHRPVNLECYQNNELRAVAEASIYREDLKALGIHPSGACGFELICDTDDGFDLSQQIVIRPQGKATVLADLSPNAWDGSDPGVFAALRRLTRKRPSTTVVFMHIPKTAGTSFNTLAQSMFPRGTVINHIELLPEPRYHALVQRYSYISGHLRFGQLRYYFDPETSHFYTILREPYAHLQSHLKWLIQTAANPQEKYFKLTNPVIYELGRKFGGISFADKRSLSQLVDGLTVTEAAFIDNLQTRYFLDHQPERIAPNDLDRALANSREFELIGATEKYESFVRGFAELNSVSPAVPTGRLNISPAKPLFNLEDEDVINILFPLVRTDLKLYHSIIGGPEA